MNSRKSRFFTRILTVILKISKEEQSCRVGSWSEDSALLAEELLEDSYATQLGSVQDAKKSSALLAAQKLVSYSRDQLALNAE
jgi:hypothetical protein